MRKYFYNLYWKIEKIIAPNLEYSQTIYEKVLKDNVKLNSSWLDLGCGHHVLPPWRLDSERELLQLTRLIVGIDYDLSSLKKHRSINSTIRGDISKLPFKDNSFELITSNMVFEHLREPKAQLKEIYRILKPGGELIFHTPNTLGYATLLGRLIPGFMKKKIIYFLQGRIEDDVFPAYYRINNPFKIKFIARANGFSVNDIRMIASSAELVMIPPLVIFELLWIRLTMSSWLKCLRTNIIVKLVKSNE